MIIKHIAVFLVFVFSLVALKWSFSRRVICTLYALLALFYIAFLSVSCFEVLPCELPTQPMRDLFPGNKVLILAPHEDDELNIAGGIFSSLAKTKEVYVAFSTNGDFYMGKEQNTDVKSLRYREAINAMSTYGIPEEHVIFLGYGDQWLPCKTATKKRISHLYEAPDDLKMTSHARMSETYGHSSHPCFHEHQPYTKSSFMQDLKDLLSYVRADAIICVDYDSHPDHRALSLSFDKVMGELLQQNPDYRPLVLKSFAYSTAWASAKNFYELNLPATPAPYSSRIMEEVNCYSWTSRLRFPVDSDSVTRSVLDNKVYKALSCHRSQVAIAGAAGKATQLIKGDKVAWWRPTNNLLLTAEVSSEVGHAEALNDFMLIDSEQIGWTSPKPFQHGWFVEEGKNNEVVFRLKQPERIREIRLYDNPSTDNCIKKLSIELSNGKVLMIRDLPSNGEPLSVFTDTDDLIDSFTLRVHRFCGKGAGLAEVEAYSEYPIFPSDVLKIMDRRGNFLYDYITPTDGVLDFSIYSNQPVDMEQVELCVKAPSSTSVHLIMQGNNAYQLCVPQGESCIVSIVDKKTHRLLDSARVHNPGYLARWLQTWQNLAEQHLIWASSLIERSYNRVIRALQ